MSDFIDRAPESNHAAPFADMAARIEQNRAHTFGGAFVVAIPGQEPMSLLQLDPDANPAVFLATLKTKLDIKIAELDEASRNQRGKGW